MNGAKSESESLEGFFDAMRRIVDPPMTSRGFTRNIGGVSPDTRGALYEIGPEDFARRFPKLKEDFGTDVAPCIDVWIMFDPRTAEIERDFGDLFGLGEWLRESGLGEEADLIWDNEADITGRVEAIARALSAYFS